MRATQGQGCAGATTRGVALPPRRLAAGGQKNSKKPTATKKRALQASKHGHVRCSRDSNRFENVRPLRAWDDDDDLFDAEIEGDYNLKDVGFSPTQSSTPSKSKAATTSDRYTSAETIGDEDFDFDDPNWKGVSATGRELVRGLLRADPERRLTVNFRQYLPHAISIKTGSTNRHGARTSDDGHYAPVDAPQ